MVVGKEEALGNSWGDFGEENIIPDMYLHVRTSRDMSFIVD